MHACMHMSMRQIGPSVDTRLALSPEIDVQDPSGYLWEVTPLMAPATEPVREINLLVSNLAASTNFYCDLLGMRALRKESGDDYTRVRPCSHPLKALSHARLLAGAACRHACWACRCTCAGAIRRPTRSWR